MTELTPAAVTTCDQCGAEIVHEGIDYTDDFLTQINSLLLAAGWLPGPGRDLCPECRVKRLKGSTMLNELLAHEKRINQIKENPTAELIEAYFTECPSEMTLNVIGGGGDAQQRLTDEVRAAMNRIQAGRNELRKILKGGDAEPIAPDR
jgi:hypothetical protein